jgi:hypothetical protein
MVESVLQGRMGLVAADLMLASGYQPFEAGSRSWDTR